MHSVIPKTNAFHECDDNAVWLQLRAYNLIGIMNLVYLLV